MLQRRSLVALGNSFVEIRAGIRTKFSVRVHAQPEAMERVAA